MRRHITRISILLILGALINVAIALALATRSPLQDGPEFVSSSSRGTYMLNEGRFGEWSVATQVEQMGVLLGRSQGLSPEELRARLPRSCLLLEWEKAIEQSGTTHWFFHSFSEKRTGFPFYTMRSIMATDPSRSDGIIKLNYPPFLSQWTRNHRLIILATYRPLWPEFAAGTVIYAIAAWLLFFAPGSARRMIRRKRGLCETCAYPIGVSAVCTECGAAVRVRD